MALLEALERRVLILDGAMGTRIHALELDLERDYQHRENCPEVLNLTRPDAIEELHREYLEVGCDIVSTNTLGGASHVLREFDLEDRTREVNRRAAEIGQTAARALSTPERPRFVFGSIGPGTKLPSLGQIEFEALLASYREQAIGLLEGGVDALLIETCYDILQAKGALIASQEALAEVRTRVPILVSVTIETTGTMLVGTDIEAAVTALGPYEPLSIGLNCATGPHEMRTHIHALSELWPGRISVHPNAGLPLVVEGRAHYPLRPEELAQALREFVDREGASIVGGCCGTTPEHLRAVVEALGDRVPGPRSARPEPSGSRLFQRVALRQETSFLIVGERTNANGSRRFRGLLAKEDWDGIVQMAREQIREGSHVLDVCTAYVGRDELRDMEAVISRLRGQTTAPLMIDSTEPPVIERALQLVGGKCAVNSINLEDGLDRMDQICPLVRRYGAAVVALTIDEQGMAKTADRKVEIARRLLELATERYGIRASDILFDPLTFTICTGNEEDRRLGLETLEAIERIRDGFPESHVLLGLSNISFGLKPPARRVLNSVYLQEARKRGLTAAIVHAGGILPVHRIPEEQAKAALRLIYDDRSSGDPLLQFVELFRDAEALVRPRPAEEDLPIEEALARRIVEGEKSGIEKLLDRALETQEPVRVINEILLEGMKTVGELFGSGEMQLPFVLQSAETMKHAVAYLESFMEDAGGPSKGTIVLATVKGDVHDIGKNLVDIIVSNNGYTVVNLGIRQPIDAILAAWREHGADAIGLSGLLVKSTQVMRDNLVQMEEEGIDVPVILGGAALTRRYVEQDLRPLYGGPLLYGKDAFAGLRIMNQLVEGEFEESTGPPAPREPRRRPVSKGPGGDGTARSDVERNIEPPKPPFWGARVVEEIPVREVYAYINETALFRTQWQFRPGKLKGPEYRKLVDEEARPERARVERECIEQEVLVPRVVYGYFPCRGEGDALVVLDPGSDEERVRFEFPRQPRGRRLCISDFFREDRDTVGLLLVTAGPRVSEVARELFESNRYREYLLLHGFGVEFTEGLAELWHRRMRQELGIGGEDASTIEGLFRQGYRGSRYSFGYPACPNLEDQEKIFTLLEPSRIGVCLTENWQLEPEQSTSAVVVHHPEARYFNVG